MPEIQKNNGKTNKLTDISAMRRLKKSGVIDSRSRHFVTVTIFLKQNWVVAWPGIRYIFSLKDET